MTTRRSPLLIPSDSSVVDPSKPESETTLGGKPTRIDASVDPMASVRAATVLPSTTALVAPVSLTRIRVSGLAHRLD